MSHPAVRTDRDEALWLMAAELGLRRSELLGLRWKSIGLTHESVTIESTLTKMGFYEGVKTKASRRIVPVTEMVVAALRRRHSSQRSDQLAAGPAWDNPLDFVFTDELGAPLKPDTVTSESVQTDLPFGRSPNPWEARSAGTPWLAAHPGVNRS